jgi:hypothetical protein
VAADFIIHAHAGRRWAERVFGIPEADVTPDDVKRGQQAVALAMVDARSAVRFGSKRRVFVTPAGLHLLVAPGRVVISVMRLEWVVPGCPCAGCLQKRADELRSGVAPPGRHGVLAHMHNLKTGNHRARRRKPRQG